MYKLAAKSQETLLSSQCCPCGQCVAEKASVCSNRNKLPSQPSKGQNHGSYVLQRIMLQGSAIDHGLTGRKWLENWN